MVNVDRDERPSPEALLAEARREARGRLKIFFGAAPGVGKTYAMLEAAQERRREGADVVVGVVETHGRRETQRLLEGLEVLPRKKMEYRDRTFEEMDLDAVVARHPKIVLVDELAHTNIPGGRHLKRYQDVEDILAAGIDVYSTLNIQHVESLNDVVERITGVKVRETVPDSVFAKADEIELVDLPPDDLIKRLAEGKVYVPEQARRAIQSFFLLGNLTALREMALRHAAERVDAQMLDYMRAHAIAGPWPARERILVCVGADSVAPRLVRAAKRMAERRSVSWVAVHVETYRDMALSEQDKNRIAQTLRLAEQLGGEAATRPGDDVAAELLAYAREHNCTQLVVGRPKRGFWPRLKRGGSVADRIVTKAGAFEILLLSGEEAEPMAEALPAAAPRKPPDWLGYAVAGVGVAAATGFGFVIYRWLPLPNISVGFLIAVLLVAMKFGRGPAIFASITGFLAYDFFFTEPRFSFSVEEPGHFLTIVFYLAAAVIVSNLTSRASRQVEATKLSARRTANLYEFSRKIAVAMTQEEVLWAVVHHVAATIRGRSLILLPRDGRLAIAAGYPPEDKISDKDAGAADWAWTRGKPAGRGSDTLPTADWLFLPLKTARGPAGVMGVQMHGQDLLTPEDSRLLGTLADQAAVAIERTAMAADVEKARLTTETERLRSALLSSISHDLRTPLVSVLGAATSLINYEETLSPKQRHDLAQTIQDEAERLNRFVQNLLDMTRLGSGSLKPKADWADLRDIVHAAVQRSERLLSRHKIRIDIDSSMPLIRVDSVLMEQVFMNLIDNARKYAPPDTTITIWACGQDGQAIIEVCDQGPGIPEADRTRVFDMFFRAEAADKAVAGTGLGLSICRGIVEAHGGTIKAEAGVHGTGTCIILNLPAPPQPVVAPAEVADG
ncbi:MAG: sensor histidine kinase KdpD [Alphaproteobacteria bacterium]